MNEALERLKKVSNEPSLGTIILAILSQIEDEIITKDPGFWHPIFQNLALRCEIPLLKQLVFNDSVFFPISDDLNQALFFLEMGPLPYYLLEQEYLISYEKDLQLLAFLKFNELDQVEIKKAAEIIKEKKELFNQDKQEFWQDMRVENNNKIKIKRLMNN